MRRDAYIQNDSGGFSILAASAADAIIEDGRSNDGQFVQDFQAMLQMLYGDDSMPVRVVVDEPLTSEEEAQWLCRSTWRIDAPDGRILVMGGFDPDVLGWWRDEHAPDEDGKGVMVVKARPGSWRVDLYAHVGSMNGREVIHGAEERPGAAFRRCHPGRPFPAWLAQLLDRMGEDDPGHEDLWSNLRQSVKDGRVALDPALTNVIGFLVHLTPHGGEELEMPSGAWFDDDHGRRLPEIFPVGLPTDARDPNIESFLDDVLEREKPKPPRVPATGAVPIIETWPGDTLTKLGGGGDCAVRATSAYLLYWLAAIGTDSPPRYEMFVSDAPDWQPPASTPEFVVTPKGRGTWAFGPPGNTGGWFTWWSARLAAQALKGLPDGATIDLAMLRDDDEDAPGIGRLIFSGTVKGGTWHVTESGPAIPRATLEDAIAFLRQIAEGASVTPRNAGERAELDRVAEEFGFSDLAWEGDTVRPEDGDERTAILLAQPVFRTRFAGAWPMDPVSEDEDD